MKEEKWEICDYCKGDGWTAEHGQWHNPETGECEGCPVQEGCDICKGTGKILKEENPPKIVKEIDISEIPF